METEIAANWAAAADLKERAEAAESALEAAETKATTLEAELTTTKDVLAEVVTAIDSPDLLKKIKDALGSDSPNDAD